MIPSTPLLAHTVILFQTTFIIPIICRVDDSDSDSDDGSDADTGTDTYTYTDTDHLSQSATMQGVSGSRPVEVPDNQEPPRRNDGDD